MILIFGLNFIKLEISIKSKDYIMLNLLFIN